MAKKKRVDVKFVVILSSVVVLAAGGVGAFWGVNWMHERDPEWLSARGREAEAKGDKEAAITYYGKATGRMSYGRAALYTKIGQLYYDLSDKDPVYYSRAMDFWNAAVTEDPKDKVTQERLVNELYEHITYAQEQRAREVINKLAAGLEDQAKRLIKLDDKDGLAYFYLGDSILNQDATLKDDRVEAAREALNKAVELLPDDPQPRWRLAWLAFRDAALLPAGKKTTADQKLTDADKMRADALAKFREFCDKHPKDVKAWIGLDQLYLLQQKPDEAAKALELARQENPGEPQIYRAIGFIQRSLDLQKAEAAYKKCVELNPDSIEYRSELANFYLQVHKLPEAIAEYKKILDLHIVGKGIDGDRNHNLNADALNQLCNAYMDLAESQTPHSKEWQTSLTTAEDYLGQIKSRRPNDTLVLVFDGRLLFLRGQTALATNKLNTADRILKNDPTQRLWRMTKYLLAQCYEASGENGLAFNAYDELVKNYQSPQVVLQRAAILIKLNRAQEARDSALAVTKYDPNNINAWKVFYTACVMLKDTKGADEALAHLPANDQAIAEARRALFEDRNEDAVTHSMEVLNLDADNAAAAAILITADWRLADQATDAAEKQAKRDEAISWADKILAKHPDNEQMRVVRQIMANPNASPDDLKPKIIESVADPYERNVAWSYYWLSKGDRDKQIQALQEAEKVVDPTRPEGNQIIDRIFMAAAAARKWDLAGRYAQMAEQKNVDTVNGRFYAARLALSRSQRDRELAQVMATLPARQHDIADMAAHNDPNAKAAQDALDTLLDELVRDHPDFQLASRAGVPAQAKALQSKLEQSAQARHDEGMKILLEATTMRPDFSMGWTEIGQAYALAGQTEQAVTALQRAVDQAPNNLMALRTLIQIKASIGDDKSLAEAQDYLKQAVRLAPRDPDLRQYEVMIGDPRTVITKLSEELKQIEAHGQEDYTRRRNLAVAYVRAGELATAIEILKPVVAKFPDDLSTADTMARLYRGVGNPDEGFKLYEKFLASDDPYIQFRALMMSAELRYSLGQYPECIKLLQLAQAKQPKDSTEVDRRLADTYFDTDDLANAESTYRKVIEKDVTKDPRLLRRLTETLIRENKFAEADDLLVNRLLKQNPDDPEGLVLRGYSLLRQNKNADALTQFNQVLVKNPDNVDALHYRAFALFASQGDLEQAINDLLHVRTLRENAINSRLLLARVYRAHRQFEESIKEYQAVLKIQPQYLTARYEYTEFLFSLCNGFLHLGNANTAYAITLRRISPIETLQKFLEESAKLFPTQPGWIVFEGDLEALQGHTDRAMALYAEAVEKSKGAPEIVVTYMSSLLSAKRFDDAIRVGTSAIEQNPKNPNFYLKRGIAYGGQGRLKEAFADFDQAVALSANSPDSMLVVTRQMFTAVPSKDVLDHLSERLKTDPKNDGLRIGIAQAQMTNIDYQSALQTLDPVLAEKDALLRPLAQRIAALAHYQLGTTLTDPAQQKKEFEASVAGYREVLTKSPSDIESLNNLALITAENLQKPKDALDYAERAMKILQKRGDEAELVNKGNVLDTYGWVLYLNDNLVPALEKLNEAVLNDQLPVTYYHLYKVLTKLNRQAEAKQNLQRALDRAKATNDPLLATIQKAMTAG